MALVTGVTVAYAGPVGAAASWSVVPSASPAGPPTGSFADVSCPSSISCFAVGGASTGPLAEHWDGSHWSIMSMPYNPTAGAFKRISCATTTSCIAVGNAVGGSTVAEWDGTAWSFTPFPGAGTGNAGLVTFESVTCTSPTSCFAVGWKGGGSSTTLIESWNGAQWSIVPSPNPPGQDANTLYDVTCASPSSCFAVGGTLIEQWDGTSWSIVTSPTFPDDTFPNLVGVSCTSESSCFAVGYINNSDGSLETTLIEAWDGASWSIVASPNAPGADRTFLLGVTCESDAACFAAGSVQQDANSPTGILGTVVEQWDGISWSIVPNPNVSQGSNFILGLIAGFQLRWNGTSWSNTTTPPVIPAPPIATLAGVSCATATKCFAVGQYENGAGRTVTLVEQPAGASWSVVASPNAAGSSGLSGVSCPSTTACFAVGSSGTGGAFRTLIERWNGHAWSITPSPNVARAVKGLTPNILLSVSCSSATNCYAVGYSIYFSYQTLIEHWDGKKWTIVPSANLVAGKGVESVLEGVSCSSATNCLAVGRSAATTSNQPGTYRTLTERWNGKAWSIVASPNAVSGSGELAGVSCAATKACVAVGNAYGSALRKSLIESWNGTAWSRVTSADPAAATHSALTGVSCASPTRCLAVGVSSGTSAANTALAKALAGGHWSNVPGAGPAGARTSNLNGVSCPTTASCFAVGTVNTSGTPLTLVERYA
jgi:hypothetical protein